MNSPTPGSPRIVVVGAGVAGLSTAYHAARLGAAVTVLDKNSVAAASSGLSAGVFNRQTIDPVDLALRVESGRQFAEFERTTSFAVNRSGYLRLARTQEQWDRAVATISAGDFLDTRLLSPDEVAELVPGMRVDDVVGAMFGEQDGFVDGPELCAAFLELGRRHGVAYHGGVELKAARSTSGQVVLDTSGDTYEADLVVNAAGPWLAQVGDLLDAPVGVDNQRHEVAVVHVPSLADRDVPAVQTYFPGSGEDSVYIRPEGRGKFLTGLHSYESKGAQADPDAYSRTVSNDYLEEVAEALVDRFPDWEDANLDAGWTGIYPHSLDGTFVVGPHTANPRVITVGGLGGVGLTVSPAIGQVAAEWAVSGESTLFDFTSAMLPDAPGRRIV